MSQKKVTQRLHPESLLNIPLVRQAIEDKKIGVLQPRAIDRNWTYHNVIKPTMTGFNPMANTILYGSISKLADWLPRAHASPRDLNLKDDLVREVLYVVHDYLHTWAYQAIRVLAPKLGFGIHPITVKNFEDMVFCHLVTEAVATVGLDYWMLSTKGINEFCDIGSNQGPLTVNFSKYNFKEYRRFNPKFKSESPKFFREIAEFYCTGEFIGFDINDMKRSPLLLDWLNHEVMYGETQRLNTRSFLNHLAAEKQKLSLAQMNEAVKCDSPWQRKLMNELGEMLWEKVKKGVLHEFPPFDPEKAWKSSRSDALDFRFSNLNVIEDNKNSLIAKMELESESAREHFLHQMVSAYQYEQFDGEEIQLITSLLQSLNVRSVHTFLRGRKKVKAVKSEPRDVMILN